MASGRPDEGRIAAQVADLLTRDAPGWIGALSDADREDVNLEAGVPVWVLTTNEADADGVPVVAGKVAAPSQRFHHAVVCGGAPQHSVVSAPASAGDEWTAVEVAGPALADAVHQALELADTASIAYSEVRLLRGREYLLDAVWLVDGGEDHVVVLWAASSYESLPVKTPMRWSDFCTVLAECSPIDGVPDATSEE